MNELLLTEKRLIGDLLFDKFINSVFGYPEQKLQLQQWLTQLKTNKQLNNVSNGHPYYSLCKTSQTLPAWADPKLMQQGVEFFARHTKAILNLLGLLSLPYCYAAANGAMVLYFSERMRSDVEKRLYETAEFVWDVMAPDAFAVEGSGFAAILKVRLMHSVVRYYTLKSKRWDEAWGFPINQEDLAGTNLSFSLITIRGLRKFGCTISYQEQSAYIHSWNVVGYLLGVNEVLLPHNGKAATVLENDIRLRQFNPSEQGYTLTASLIAYFCKANDGDTYTNADIYQLMHYLLGSEIAKLLRIKGGKLLEGKVRLLHLRNSIKELTLSGNSRQLYGQAFSRFKRTKPYSS
jgi:hypothetical protein